MVNRCVPPGGTRGREGEIAMEDGGTTVTLAIPVFHGSCASVATTW
jgi:hypothetical protein